MGDHAVLIVKAWYKLTWGFIHSADIWGPC